MEFTYTAYQELLSYLKVKGYTFECFDDDDNKKTVICRHDVDTSLKHTLQIAKIEKELGIRSIYFVLLSTNFYNIFSFENRKLLKELQDMGHTIGLHFDSSIYSYQSNLDLENQIMKEIHILENLIGNEVKTVSFHRPIKELFNKKLKCNVISAYEEKYFTDFEYVSDSRRNWRRDPYEVINGNPHHIQLLTHPIWYSNDKCNTAMDAINRLKNSMNETIETSLYNNISDYNELMKGEF